MLAQPVPPTYFHQVERARDGVQRSLVGVLFGKGQPKPLLDEAAARWIASSGLEALHPSPLPRRGRRENPSTAALSQAGERE